MRVKEFKFFYGFTIDSEGIQGIVRTLQAQWRPELIQDLNVVYAIDAEAELTRLMSEEIARGIDEEIINTLTRRINGGGNQGFEGPIQRINNNSDYFNRWMDIGGYRA